MNGLEIDWMYALEIGMVFTYIYLCFKADKFIERLYWGELDDN